MDECIHGLGPVEACVICNGRAERERAEQAAAYRVFPAKFDSQCSACNLPIHAGDDIGWRPDEPAIHAHCIDD